MRRIDIREFGAMGDGITINTSAIQQAIDACETGDRVYIPEGVFVTGPIFLKSDMGLYLEEGALLQGSDRLEDYPLYRYRYEGREQLCYASLISTADIRDSEPTDPWYEKGIIEDPAKRLKNIVIEGSGIIDAGGASLGRKEMQDGKGVRGRAIAIRNTDGVRLSGVTVRQSPAWCVHPIFCTDVVLENVTIRTKYGPDGQPYGLPNGDGLDPDSCKGVRVRHCVIESQDDCIAVKSGKDAWGRLVGIPCEDVVISDCIFRYGFGVAMGSEMSGGVRNVLVKDCVFEDTYSLASIKAPRGRGGCIENITYENLKHTNRSTEHKDCRWFRGAVYIDQFYSHDEYETDHAMPVDEGTATIRNIVFKNVETSTVAGNAIFFMGLPENKLQNIQLTQVKAHGKTGMIAGNIQGLEMEQVTVTAEEGEARIFIHVE